MVSPPVPKTKHVSGNGLGGIWTRNKSGFPELPMPFSLVQSALEDGSAVVLGSEKGRTKVRCGLRY